jgi:hypothetical protein
MSNQETKQQPESLEEPEKIEGNYYKVDLFVSSALIFFAILIVFLEKSLNWTIFLIFLAVFFLLRGIKNWKRKSAGTQHVEDWQLFLILSHSLKKAVKTGIGRIITLTTDFGTQDGYVGVMKGVICSVAPKARIVEITHEIEPGNVAQASFVLESFHTFYPEGTVNLVVVDPGVGSERRALALESAGRFYIGPDNGVFEPVLGSAAGFRCYELTERKFHLKDISRTFHGRDIFAPAAALLSGG